MTTAGTLAATAEALATYAPRRTSWFDDLVVGRGAAKALAPELRTALVVLTAAKALDLANAQAARDVAARHAERELRAAPNRAIVGFAFARLGTLIIPAAILVVATAIVAAIGAYFADQFGQTSFSVSLGLSSGPSSMFAILSSAVAVLLVAMFVVDLSLGPPSSDHLYVAFWWGLVVGVGLFLVFYFPNLTTVGTWFIAPACLAIAYLIAATQSGARLRLQRGETFTYRQLSDSSW